MENIFYVSLLEKFPDVMHSKKKEELKMGVDSLVRTFIITVENENLNTSHFHRNTLFLE